MVKKPAAAKRKPGRRRPLMDPAAKVVPLAAVSSAEDLFAGPADGPAHDAETAAMADLAARQSERETLTVAEVAHLSAFRDRVGPAILERAVRERDQRDPKEPDDVLARTQKELAALSGLHENSIGNYKRTGVAPLGPAPWSLKAWFLLLRQHGKLSETKPSHKGAQQLRAWAFGNGDASDPNDPAHGEPRGWAEEQHRQTALKTLKARQKEEVELDTLRKVRIPVDEYRARWRRRRDQVLGHLDSFMGVVRHVPDLSEKQRLALNRAIRDNIASVRGKLAPKGAPAAGADD